MEIITWITLSIFVGIYAGNKGRSKFVFTLLSLILSPLLGIALALIARPNLQKAEKNQIKRIRGRKCPKCAEIIKKDAIKCRFCGSDLEQDDL